MSVVASVEQILTAFPKRILGALVLFLATGIGLIVGSFGTLWAQNWWLSTKGYAYYFGVARDLGTLEERVEKLERKANADQKLAAELAEVKLALWNLDGKVEVLLDRPRPRRKQP